MVERGHTRLSSQRSCPGRIGISNPPIAPAWRRLGAAIAFLACSAGAAQAAIPATERQALLDLFNATNGPGWTNKTGWGGAAGTECAWYGVACDASGSHVTGISMYGVYTFHAYSGNNLTGALPSLAGLGALQSFDVSYNGLTGPIPPLNGLKSLQTFDAFDNRLTGPIPSLTGMTALQTFDVSVNQLSGPLPPLAGLSALRLFQVNGNQLTGTIPSLQGLGALQTIYLDRNQLTGPVPALSGLANLQTIYLEYNRLEGPIPAPPPSLVTYFEIIGDHEGPTLCNNYLTTSGTTSIDNEWATKARTDWLACQNRASPTCSIGREATAGNTTTLTIACTPGATSYSWTGGTCAGKTGPTCTVQPVADATYAATGRNPYGSHTVSTNVSGTPNATRGPFAYIPHFQSNYVSVVHVPTGAVFTTIEVGRSPEGVAVAPGGKFVYVTNFGSNDVSVLDTDTMTNVARIPVGAGPRGIAVSPDGNRVFAVNSAANNVSVIDAASRQVVGSFPTGAGPWGVAIKPISGLGWIANHDSNSITVFEELNGVASGSSIAGISQPFGLVMSPDSRNLYVAEFGADEVAAIHPFSFAIEARIPVDAGPFALAPSPDGSRLYVTTNADIVSVVDTKTSTKIASIAVGAHPQGIAVTPDGKQVLVVNFDGNSLYTIDAATNRVKATTVLADGPVAFGSFIVAPKGTVMEFYHGGLDNYFITADANEAAAIDSGAAGPGWSRTGKTFKSGGETAACRFYGSITPGPNSHFYTADGAECAALKVLQQSTPSTQKRWNFESLDFQTTLRNGGGGTCPSGTVPVFRAYNNGFSRGVDSNHRIVADAAAIQAVVARGWTNEGTVMCAPQ